MPETENDIESYLKIFPQWGLFAGAICLLFAPISVANWGTAIAIVLSWCFIPKMCLTLGSIANTPKQKLWVFILAFVAFTVIVFAPRLAVFVWEIPPQMLWYFFIIYPLTLLKGLEKLVVSSNYRLVDDHPNVLITSLICNIVPLPFLIRYGMSNWNFYDAAVNVFIQLFLTLLCVMATTFMGVLLAGKWNQLDDSGDGNAEPAAPTVVQPTLARQRRPIPKFECDDCFSEYTDIKIPRVLKECGHTICEQCADKLLAENNQRHLLCPLCETVTLVYGTVEMLPINYVITDLMAAGN
ncbi:hypothetical protein CRE_21621 [Caenorhabditis remanei]|uniref:RING-type domain-containing protein n=1 Tax=Caenorhabditis remanei TaxID=31234 RepID=E3NNY4_CAERE|nr:hypothetical protein CRE_21621 [Caenorhabditis remanei]